MDIATKHALCAMVFISFAPSLARTIMVKHGLSSIEILTISTLVVNVILIAAIYLQGEDPVRLINFSRGFWLSCLLGVIFGGSLLFYYSALAKGEVTLVVPIWGLQIVGGSLVAVIFLKEGFDLNRIAAVLLAIGAIFFSIR